MKPFLIVGAGGFLGAVARYGVWRVTSRLWAAPFPLATFLVNISGSFILGFFTTWAASRADVDPAWRLFVATGFVGAYTTFSTFEYETHQLNSSGALTWAAVNMLGSLVAGYLAVALGVRLAR